MSRICFIKRALVEVVVVVNAANTIPPSSCADMASPMG